jgi:phosphate transport system substrate-binding protein
VVAFLRWVLTEGQQYVGEAGYVNLPPDKIADEMKKLRD